MNPSKRLNSGSFFIGGPTRSDIKELLGGNHEYSAKGDNRGDSSKHWYK